jgi:hypothetical protein
VPPGVRLGRNVRVDVAATTEDYAGQTWVPSGATIRHTQAREDDQPG